MTNNKHCEGNIPNVERQLTEEEMEQTTGGLGQIFRPRNQPTPGTTAICEICSAVIHGSNHWETAEMLRKHMERYHQQ